MALPEHWIRLDGGQSPPGPSGETRLNRAGVQEVIRDTRREARKLRPEKIKARTLDLQQVSNGYRGGQVVVGAYESAQTVMAETVAGLKQDLDQFATDLEACLSALDDADELSAGTLARMAAVTPGEQAATSHDTAANDTGFRVNADEVPPEDTSTPPSTGTGPGSEPAECAPGTEGDQ
jgi:hypothetical protein